jgi:hypothetical protein
VSPVSAPAGDAPWRDDRLTVHPAATKNEQIGAIFDQELATGYFLPIKQATLNTRRDCGESLIYNPLRFRGLRVESVSTTVVMGQRFAIFSL